MKRRCSFSAGPGGRGGSRSAFTLIETLMTVIIISVISSLVLVNVSTVDATSRLDRAAQHIIAALRYARIESLSHSQTVSGSSQPSDGYGVYFNTVSNTVTVYHTTWNPARNRYFYPGTTVINSLIAGGSYVVNLNTQSDCAGVKISSVRLNGTSDTRWNTRSPYACQFRPMGTTPNYGQVPEAITLTYGGRTCTISIPPVGDPQVN
jgi:prepilin-type N-terminal cleavage/methylation domain-containing protein